MEQRGEIKQQQRITKTAQYGTKRRDQTATKNNKNSSIASFDFVLVEGVWQKQEDNESAKQHNALSLSLSLSVVKCLSVF